MKILCVLIQNFEHDGPSVGYWIHPFSSYLEVRQNLLVKPFGKELSKKIRWLILHLSRRTH